MNIIGFKEVFNDFKLPMLLVAMPYCDWKCCIEQNIPITTCQNNHLDLERVNHITNEELTKKILNNILVDGVIFGGLETINKFSFPEILDFVEYFRSQSDKPIVIYTGYYPDEILDEVTQLQKYNNIYMKFGRFKINSKTKYDGVLGITLSSENQFGIKIS